MPTYTYKCYTCQHTFDKFVKLADMHVPEGDKCEECGDVGAIKKIMTTVPINFSGVTVTNKHSDGWKDLTGRMRKNIPKNNIPDYS